MLKELKQQIIYGDSCSNYYICTVNSIQLMTPDEVSLQSLDHKSADELVNTHIGLVESMANKYRGRTTDMNEMMSDGYVALLHAARLFDATKGTTFEKYASWKIRQRMERTVMHQQNRSERSLDAPLREGVMTTLHDLIPSLPEYDPLADITSEQLSDIGLSAREVQVVRHFYGFGMDKLTYYEIGQQMNLKRERVRQILKKALRKIRKTEKVLFTDNR